MIERNFEKQTEKLEEIFLKALKNGDGYVKPFQELIYVYYDHAGRIFPWRETREPYKIFISEVMLQQTQTDRVVQKYLSWIKRFPSFKALAKASFPEVLEEWQGLGYNRRAKFLHESAKKSIEHFNGSIPNNPEELVEFPGIGSNTAASITAFAFNKPVVFIETNIRALYIHMFFRGQTDVHDNDLMIFIEETLDRENAKEWYNALMDYGVMLKKKYKNPSRKSKHHTKQKAFKGSDREIRGAILKALVSRDSIPLNELPRLIDKNPERVEKNVANLEKEGFVVLKNNSISLSS